MRNEASVERGGTIETVVPARLDRLPWSKFQWMAIGVAELLWRVSAEQQLDDIAEPLSAEGEKEKPKKRRHRLGPGSISTSIERALREHGSANGRELRQRVRARYWGPGRFREALRAAIAAGRVKPLPRGQFAPVEAPREDA